MLAKKVNMIYLKINSFQETQLRIWSRMMELGLHCISAGYPLSYQFFNLIW